jgi:hypothetical protein
VPYKSALLMLTLAIMPLLYVNAWLSAAAAIAAYVVAAKLANRHMNRAFLIRSLKGKLGQSKMVGTHSIT